MSFRLGKPILAMLLVSLVTGGAMLARPRAGRKDLLVWVFAESHFKAYQPLIPGFERKSGKRVDLQVVQDRAQQVRLQGIFSSDARSTDGGDVPDLVEIEISRVGKFFRPPLDDIGFVPLADLNPPGQRKLREPGLLERDRLVDAIVRSRYAPWTKQGVVFGIPHDLHPCTITFREDLFREAGVDLSRADTWPRFQELCLKFQEYWRARGFRQRHAVRMENASSDTLTVMLLQRGINLVDDYNHIHLADPKVAATVAFYAQLVAGPRNIAGMCSDAEGPFTRDIVEGNLCAFVTPDWRAGFFRRWVPQMAGRMRMMPLPVFEPTDAPTGTWGGTMIAILKKSKNREAAWQLAKRLYFSADAYRELHDQAGIVPPVVAVWDRPEYHAPDPLHYFGDQSADAMFFSLARRLPRRCVTPATNIAAIYLSNVLNKAVGYVKQSGSADGLEPLCQQWLDDAARDLGERMKQWEFD